MYGFNNTLVVRKRFWLISLLSLFFIGCEMNTTIETTNEVSKTPSFNVSDSTTLEGNSVNFVFNLDEPAESDFEIEWAIEFDNSSPVDLSALSGSVKIKKGDSQFVIIIPTSQDNIFEADEDFNLVFTSINGKGSHDVIAKGTIENDDPPPEVSFQVTSQTVQEDIGTVTTLVQMSAAAGLDIYIPYTISGTADGNDHNQINGILPILAGDSATVFIMQVIDDSLSESDEDVIITLSTPANAILGVDKVHTVTIQDNDTNIVVQVPTNTDYANIANETALTVSGTCTNDGQPVSITIDDTNGVTAAVTPGVQPNCSSGMFTASVDVSSLDDDTLTITVDHVAQQDLVNITKDVLAPTLTVDQSVNETIGSCNFPAQIDPDSFLPVVFKVVASEPIDVSSFVVDDIDNGGTGGGTTLIWNIINCGDDKTFMLEATAVAPTGTLIPSIAIGAIADKAANTNNSSSSSTDGSVNYAPNPFLWTGVVDSNWSTDGNWLGGTAPGAGDVASFDSSCGANCNATIDAAINVAGVELLSGYTGTITQGVGSTIDIGTSGWMQAGGTFAGSNANITIVSGTTNISNGIFTSTSATLKTNDNFSIAGVATFNHNSGIFRLNGNQGISLNTSTHVFNDVIFGMNAGGLDRSINLSGSTFYVSGNLTINQVGSTGTACDITNGSIDLKGDYTIIDSSGMTSSDALVIFSGTGTQNISGTGAVLAPQFSSSGTIEILNDITFLQQFYKTSGSVNINSHKVTITGNMSLNSNNELNAPGVEFQNLRVDFSTSSDRDIDILGNISVNGNLELYSSCG